MSWVEDAAGGAVLSLRVVPNASRDEIVGPHAGKLKVKVQRPPEDGKANRALLKLIAAELGVSKSSLAIVGGAKTRLKRIMIDGTSAEFVREKLGDI